MMLTKTIQEVSMRVAYLSLVVVALAATLALVHAQAVPDVSGHWEGSLEVPTGPVLMVLDIAKDARGALGGTVSQPAQGINGLPLLKVLIEGQKVTIAARDDQPFSGVLGDDGKSIAGALSLEGYNIPVTFTRIGDAKIDAPVKSPTVDKRFEGAWHGTAGNSDIVLTITNRADGTAIAELVNMSEGGLRVPVARIKPEGARLTLELKAISGSYEGEVNVDGTELSGIYKQGQMQEPITFRRAR
jgi:hypothetical protein